MSDNTLATARAIFPIASSQPFPGFIGVESGVLDPNDYYRFTLSRSSSVTVSLTNLSADANIEILNSSGAIVTDTNGITLRSANTGSLNESLNTILDAGTYYIRVLPGPALDPADPLTTPSTNYTLNVATDSNIQSDLLWRNTSDGTNAVWVMNQASLSVGTLLLSVPDLTWRIQAVADFNNDSNTDIVWRNIRSGENLIWFMNGTTFSTFASLPTVGDQSWQIQAAADVSGDGRPDILWRNFGTGQNIAWFMNGGILTTFGEFDGFTTDTRWRLQAVADFNNDGQTDFVWRFSAPGAGETGSNQIALMNGLREVNRVVIPTRTDLNWEIQGSGDFNRDGRPDIVWRNYSTLENQVWFMNGVVFLSSATINPIVPPEWRLLAPFNRFLPPVSADVAGNTPGTAFSIGTINGNGIYRDAVGTTDVNDYYQFFLGNQQTNLNLSLAGLAGGSLDGNIDIEILNSVGAVVANSAEAGSSPEQIIVNLGRGTYFIRVLATPGSSSRYQLNISANNLPELVSNNPLTVDEGAQGVITGNLLLVTDENNPPPEVTYRIVSPTRPNSLSLNGAAITTGSIFTQADINNNRLTYRQDGSEVLTDSFVFTAFDPVGGSIGPNQTFTINVNPVNDGPTLLSNAGLTLSEGATGNITGTILRVTDVEQTDAQLIYTLNQLPGNGSLTLDGRALTLGSTFTQADVTSGTRLSYTHSGSETTSDRILFTLTDGAGGTLTPAPSTFNILVTPVNDLPVLVTNLGLTVNQDQASTITAAVLRTTDAEFATVAQQDLILYTITQLPTRGTLFLNGTSIGVNGTFSQADLNNGRVLYDHDGSTSNSDRFTFTVSDGTTTLPAGTFDITVNVVNAPPVLTTNTGLTLDEAATATIGQGQLLATDTDSPPPSLLYTLGTAPVNGQILRLGAALTAGQTFTQADIDGDRIAYQHNGSETTSDRFTFTLSDNSGNTLSTQTFTIGVRSVNDAPSILTNTGLTLSEGSAADLTGVFLRATDVDNLDAQITYTLVTPPGSGTLLIAGNPATTFTQSDVNNGQLRYQNNGSESTSDSFTFTISDGGTPVGPRTFNISVLPVNDLPLVLTNTGLTLNEGASSAINTTGTTRLFVTDVDGPNPVTLTLANAATQGVLLRGNSTLSAGQTFTPADLNTLAYVHNGSETTNDSFSFTASDGVATTPAATTFSINITPVNDGPVLVSNVGLALSEGSSATLSNAILSMTDNDTPLPASLTYQLTSGPANGQILLAGTATTRFTQTDVNSGQVRYEHNGSETTSDSFTFDITDGSAVVSANTFNIGITPINDLPGVSVNAGITLNEGGTVNITGTELLVTDNDGPGPLTYTLGTAPTRGALRLNGVTLSQAQTFSQSDISSGRISYVHDGSETTSDRFVFTLSDGATGTLSATTFNITVTPVNDAPVLVSNGGLALSENGVATISNALLQATDAETTLPSNLRYTVTGAPANGTLLLAGTPVTSFTQPDINSGQLRYRHNGSETVIDSFTFDVSDGSVSLPAQVFNIAITPVNDNPGFAANTGLAIAEGDAATVIANTALQLTDNDGPGPIVYTLASVPTSGTLLLASSALTIGQTFTQADIDSSLLAYANSGSETTGDRFTFTASDSSTGTIALSTFSITITSVNDAPVLVSNGGLALSENGVATISNALLQATDAETTLPSNLRYTVTGAPTNGTLLLAGTPVTSFTQADINSGQLRYRHNGSETVIDSFTFDVSDGSVSLPAQVFNIAITPVNDNPGFAANTGLTIAEGDAATVIANTALQLTDNDGPGPIVYTLASVPTSGNLLLSGSALTIGQTFTQADIDSSLLAYANNGSETTGDRFTFTASDSSTGTIALSTFSITVTAANDAPVLVSNGGLALNEGATATINNALLLTTDAETTLAANLRYTVTGAPTNGTLLLAGTPVSTFTQSDINSGQLRYRHNGSETVTDSFTFDISDGATSLTAQVFNIAVTPVNDNPGLVTNAGLSVTEGDPPTVIANTALQLTDNDGPGPIVYTLASVPTSGTLLLASSALSIGQTFTQADIDSSLLAYANSGSETTGDRFTFTASDSSTGTIALSTFSITVTAVNDAPVLVSNGGLALSEGATATINNTRLLTTDAETPLPASLRYTVTGAPTNGTLLLAGTPVSTFTQADVNSGQLRYRHNGSETVTDSFTFDVSDDTQTISAVFDIDITPVNDAPGISLNTVLSVAEGGSIPLSNGNLLITDNDGPGPLAYTIGTAPTRGALLLNGITLTANQSFTQAAIDNNQLSYVHDGSETTSDRFTFTATDGSTGTIPLTTFSLAVVPVNDAPIITLPGAQSVNEDTPLPFTGANLLRVTDVDTSTLQVSLTASTGGILSLNPGSLTVSGNGTNAIVVSGALTALNSALASLTFRGVQDFNGPATITIQADDLNGGVTVQTLDVTVVPVNDAPTLTIPPGTQTVDEDTVLNLVGITVTDVDASSGTVQATLSVTNGGLTLNDTTGISFENDTNNGGSTLTVTGAIDFIQTALSSLSYQGNPDFFGSDTLTVLINDQGATGIGGARSISRTVPITVVSVNDRPTFSGGPNIQILEDAGAQTLTGWATNLLPGPANESSQAASLNFVVTGNTNAALFSVAPSISSAGTLTFTAAPNANGTAIITTELRDNGSVNNASVPYTFTVNVVAVNDAPSFTRGPNQIVSEDAPLQNINNWATAISRGPADESGQTLTFQVDNNNASLFAIAPTISSTGVLTYQLAPDANGVAVVTVRLRDNGGTDNGGVDVSAAQTFTITANAVNDAPVLTVPGAQTTNEDETLTIPGVSITDVDAGSNPLQIRLSAPNGLLGIAGAPSVTIANNNTGSVTLTGTLTALNTALNSLTYRGRPDFQGPSDTLTIAVSDQGNTGSGGTLVDTEAIAITINAVNDGPVVTVPTSRSVQEDTDLVLTGINVTDIDAGAGAVQLTLSATNGRLNVADASGATITGNNSGEVLLSGTLTQIRAALTTANNVRYRGNQDYNGPDTVTVTLNDQGNTGSGGGLSDSRSFSINVTAVNDLPTLTLPAGPLTLNEDDPTGLVFTQGTPTEILLTDVDSGNNPIRVSLSVSNGTLSLGSTTGLTPVSGADGTGSFTFTGTVSNAIAALNNLTYRSNPNFNGASVLTITVNDQGNTGSGVTPAPTVTRSLTINATPVNDVPVLLSNRGLTLNEGETRQILNGLLNTTDVDTADTPDQLVYTLVSRPNPANGSLLLVNGATTATLTDNSTFTQADINAGRLRYAHSGSENPTDTFSFRVSDGDVTIPDPASTFNFNITVNPRNDIPVLLTNLPLNLTEGGFSTISNSLLRVTDPDNIPTQLRYTLTSAPSNGTLLLNGSTLSATQSFTQADINTGALSYRHSGSESTSDSFNFVVTDTAGGSTGSRRFTVQVAAVNDLPVIVSRGPLTLNEGAEITINNTILRTTDPDGPQPLTYRLTDTPTTGTLRRNGTTLAIGDTFTQQEIDLGLISYEHNDAEVFEDVFNFAVSDDGFATSTRSFVRILINPINDNPVLLTNAGLTIDGNTQNTITPIGAGLLQVTDTDTPDQNLRYTLTSVPNPSVGVLQLDGAALSQGGSFTQADLNAGRVSFRYFSDGFSETFQFSLSDGAGGTIGTDFFNIFFDYSTV
jgi:hypothetical protein